MPLLKLLLSGVKASVLSSCNQCLPLLPRWPFQGGRRQAFCIILKRKLFARGTCCSTGPGALAPWPAQSVSSPGTWAHSPPQFAQDSPSFSKGCLLVLSKLGGPSPWLSHFSSPFCCFLCYSTHFQSVPTMCPISGASTKHLPPAVPQGPGDRCGSLRSKGREMLLGNGW